MTAWKSHGRVSAALPSGASSSASSPCDAARAAAVARSLERPVVSGLAADAYAAAVPPAAAPGSATTVTCRVQWGEGAAPGRDRRGRSPIQFLPQLRACLPAAAAMLMREWGPTWTRPCPSSSHCKTEERVHLPAQGRHSRPARAHLLYAAHVMLTAAMARPEMMDAWFSFSVLRAGTRRGCSSSHAVGGAARTWR